MKIDKEKLRAAAIDWGHHPMEIAGDDVLDLLAEIERLDRESQNLSSQLGECDRERRAFRGDRDQLKAENEALRRDARRYRFLRNQHWPVAELAVVCNPKVSVKLGYDCPSGDRLDQQVDGAMIRGASHD
ncbi:hypothetical protein ACI2KG_00610 [Pseudomonas sp. NPDC089407]|uniref:hypothetical protein n=1 Tax=Pseudomonas sp. NPDC089407 TaxID=3364464 RepID=UPI00385104DC